MNRSELFLSINEYFAAGIFELDGEAPIIRYSLALKRFWENTDMPEYSGGTLYPCGVCTFNYNGDLAVKPHYSLTFSIDGEALKKKSEEAYAIIRTEYKKTACFFESPHTVGGMGWTHSFPNYSRILKEGLNGYIRRIDALEEGDFKKGMSILLEGIKAYHSRCLEHLYSVCAPKELIEALERVPYLPPRNVYEALVSINFIYYVDGCDDIGPLDRNLLPYYNGEDIVEILRDLFKNIDENDGWSGSLGPDYNELTRACLRAIRGKRRPSLQLLVKPDMPDWVWEESASSLSTGCGQPAFYNYELYMKKLREKFPHLPKTDLDRIAFGGCTETMLEGISNVGSDDAGVNVALVFSDHMRANLTKCASYEDFYSGLIIEIRRVVAETLDLVIRYRRTRAEHRPDVVRTLFVDDCIERRKEFNDGGARWNWSCINVAGVINVIDSLCVIKSLIYDTQKYDAKTFLEKMDERDPIFLALAERCPSFGNDNDEADLLGNALLDEIVKAFEQRDCYPDGKFIAVSNQFTTYVSAGKKVPATPDGRSDGAPLADSLGAIHGNDTEGPTAMLNSVAKLGVSKVLGSPITNIRISKNNLPTVLKPLVEAYFAQGGMQLQVSCLSREDMIDALEHPEDHKNLIVRIGGFSEYFNRLSHEMKLTVIERTEHC